MIKFIKIWGTGFGSFVNETKFKLDRPGLNILIAKNGSGKTTVFNLLNWILYGTVLKDIKNVATWKRFRPDDWKGTIGRFKFEKNGVDYEIIRCKDYKGKVLGSKGGDRVIVLQGGVDISPRDKRERQKLINDTLGYTSGLFKNIILFGQKLKRLTQESGPEKKKVFDEAFESQFIKEARDRADEKLKIIQADFNEIDTKVSTLKIKLEANKKSYLKLKQTKAKIIEEQKTQIAKVKAKIKVVDKVLTEYNAVELKICQRKIEKTKREQRSLENIAKEIKDLEDREFREQNLADDIEHRWGKEENKIAGAKESLKSVLKKCPRCGQKLSGDKIKVEKKKLIQLVTDAKSDKHNLTLQLDAQLKVVEAIKEQISSKIKDKDKIEELKITLRKLERELKPLIDKDNNFRGAGMELDMLNKQLKHLKKQRPDFLELKTFKQDIGKLRKSYKKEKPYWKELKIQIKHLKWAMDDVLSNKGLKAYIFEAMLKELNELLKYYEQFIGYRVEFNIDFDSANKDIYTLCYIGEHSCFYEELSGAQAQLVDIATAFALNDLVTRGRPINIMVFDEVFDGLDEDNEEVVYDLINNKALTTSLFLITHNLDLQSASTKVIRMSYDAVTGQTIMKRL